MTTVNINDELHQISKALAWEMRIPTSTLVNYAVIAYVRYQCDKKGIQYTSDAKELANRYRQATTKE